MPIAMRCPGCDTRFEFASDLEGKRIKCKNCGDVFSVERPVRKSREEEYDDRQPSRSRRLVDDDRPSSRSRRDRDDDRDDDRPRRYRDEDDQLRKKKIHPLVIFGPLAGIALIGIVVVIILATRGDKKKSNPVAEPGDVVKAPTKSCPLEVTEQASGFQVIPDSGNIFGLIRKKESSPVKKDWIYDAYDLASGRRVGRIDLTKVEEPKAWSLSPDGKHLLVTEIRGLGWAGEHRVHLITVADGTDIDWKPFPDTEKRGGNAPAMFRAEFVSNDRIVTLGTNRAMYFYRFGNLNDPDSASVSSVGDQLGKIWGPAPDNFPRIQWQMALTADRRKMAVWNGDGYAVVDTENAQEFFRTPSLLVTARELWPRESVKRDNLHAGPAAFSPDGSVLAGVITHGIGSKQHVLCLWDAKEEKSPVAYEIPANQYGEANTLRWWGNRYILVSGAKFHGSEVDGMLIDTRTGLPVRQLMSPKFRHYGLGRDGRLWYVSSPDPKEPAMMHVLGGPDGDLTGDATSAYEEIPDLKDSFLRRLWMEPSGILRKPTRENPPLQQGLIRRP
jgi:transcription initiation factor TFIIIB Brf1 subunit/transcription initiation factor TFIIB